MSTSSYISHSPNTATPTSGSSSGVSVGVSATPTNGSASGDVAQAAAIQQAAKMRMRNQMIVVASIIAIVQIIVWAVLGVPHLSLPPPSHDCLTSALSPSNVAINERLAAYTDTRQLSRVRESTRSRWIHLSGDSLTRLVYYDLVSILSRHAPRATGELLSESVAAERTKTRHSDQKLRIGSLTISYTWAPYLADVVKDIHKQSIQPKAPDCMIMGAGLWDLLYHPDTLAANITWFANAIKKNDASSSILMWKSVSSLEDNELAEHHQAASQFRDSNVIKLNNDMAASFINMPIITVDGYNMSANRSVTCPDDGVHSLLVSSRIATSISSTWICIWDHNVSYTLPQITLVLLFSLCAAFVLVCEAYIILVPVPAYMQVPEDQIEQELRPLRSADGGASSPGTDTDEKQVGLLVPDVSLHLSDHSTTSSLPSSLSSSVSPAVAVATAVDAASSSPRPIAAASRPIIAKKRPDMPPRLWFYPKAIQASLRALLILALLLVTLYLFDGDNRVTWDMTGDKVYTRDTFMLLLLVIAAAGAMTIVPTTKNTSVVLNREQTEEWKGFMQIGFVMYHYFKAEEFYNPIRVFIGAYVWMTGYGNFLYFYSKADYSISRLAKMLFRLNFLVFFVCAAMNREFMQYYVCALHTFYFMVVYLTMWIGNKWNKIRLFMYFKFIVVFVILYVIYDVSPVDGGALDAIWGKFDVMYWNNTLYEWKFRSKLDHYASLWGMIFAYHLPQFDALLAMIEAATKTTRRVSQGVIISIMSAILISWAYQWGTMSKFTYNISHPYTSVIPITAYVILRNATPFLRTRVMHMFAWCGKITLETYIFQFHTWLSDDAGTLLFFIPKTYPLINWIIASIIYIFLSNTAFKVTNVISEHILPADGDKWDVFTRTSIAIAIWFTGLNLARAFI